jgi:hypothetical protein
MPPLVARKQVIIIAVISPVLLFHLFFCLSPEFSWIDLPPVFYALVCGTCGCAEPVSSVAREWELPLASAPLVTQLLELHPTEG